MVSIYFAHPIDRVEALTQGIRDKFQSHKNQIMNGVIAHGRSANYTTIQTHDPHRYWREIPAGGKLPTPKTIVEGNREILASCDGVVAWLPAGVPSVGVPMEIAEADRLGIPLVVISSSHSIQLEGMMIANYRYDGNHGPRDHGPFDLTVGRAMKALFEEIKHKEKTAKKKEESDLLIAAENIPGGKAVQVSPDGRHVHVNLGGLPPYEELRTLRERGFIDRHYGQRGATPKTITIDEHLAKGDDPHYNNGGHTRYTIQWEGDQGFMPIREYSGDAGYDLFVAENTTIPPDCTVDIPCGGRIGLPDGVWVEITGRSSTLRSRGLLVVQGIIDNGYTGPLFVGVRNLNSHSYTVAKGDRIAQMIPHQLMARGLSIEWVAPDGLKRGDRGDKGFGSTGP